MFQDKNRFGFIYVREQFFDSFSVRCAVSWFLNIFSANEIKGIVNTGDFIIEKSDIGIF